MNEYASSLAGQTRVGAEASRDSPFQSLSTALDALIDARSRVAKVANVIVGQARPTPIAAGKLASIEQGGLVDQVERAAETIRSLASAIHGDITRIENRL